MNYHKNKEFFSAYLDGMLDKKTEEGVKKHLESCLECNKIVGEIRKVGKLLSTLEKIKPAPGFEAEILSKIEKRTSKVILPFPGRYLSYAASGLIVLLVAFLFLKRPFTQPELRLTKVPEPTYKKSREIPLPISSGVSEIAEEAAISSKVMAKIPDEEKETEKVMDYLIVPAEEKVRGKREVVSDEKKLAFTAKRRKAIAGYSRAALDTSSVVPSNFIIRNNEDWGKIWNVQNVKQNLSLPLPEVDFKRQMAIAVSSQENNVEYKIIKIEEKKDKIVVKYQELPVEEKDKPFSPYQIEIVNNKEKVEFQKVD